MLNDLQQRRATMLEAVDRVSTELMEVDPAFLEGRSQADCIEALGRIRAAPAYAIWLFACKPLSFC